MHKFFIQSLMTSTILALAACGGGSGGDTGSSSSSVSSSSSSASSSSSSSVAAGPFSIEPDFNLYDLAEFPVGVAVSAANENYSIFNDSNVHDDAALRRELIPQHFSQLTAGNIMKMSYLHDDEGVFTFADADELVGFAETNGMTVHGHALFWHPDYQIPNWASAAASADTSAAEWENLLTNHVKGIVEHFDTEFPGVVVSWDVVNEAIDASTSDDWRHSIFYDAFPAPAAGEIPDYIRVAFQAARDHAHPDVDLYYNDYDNTANTDRLNKTLVIAEALAADGLIDGIGFQMHVYMDYPSIDNFRNAFQQVVDLGLKVKITELDVSVVNPYGSGTPPPQPEYDEELAGDQKLRFCQIAEVYMEVTAEKPELRGGITVWGLTDDESWLMNQFNNNIDGANYDDVWPLLFNADLSAKPALQGVADALRGIACTRSWE